MYLNWNLHFFFSSVDNPAPCMHVHCSHTSDVISKDDYFPYPSAYATGLNSDHYLLFIFSPDVRFQNVVLTLIFNVWLGRISLNRNSLSHWWKLSFSHTYHCELIVWSLSRKGDKSLTADIQSHTLRLFMWKVKKAVHFPSKTHIKSLR